MKQGKCVDVTPTIDTNAYADGDQLGDKNEVTGVNQGGAYPCTLKTFTVTDKAKQSAAIDILLFDEDPTVSSSDNDAADVSDSELKDKAVAVFSVAAGDYSDLNANSVATVKPDVTVCPKDSSLWALAVSRGTPTYASTGDLTFKFNFEY